MEDQSLDPEAIKAIQDYFQDLKEGRCPTCKQPVVNKEQVGRCVYALPCKHRLYQGKLKKETK